MTNLNKPISIFVLLILLLNCANLSLAQKASKKSKDDKTPGTYSPKDKAVHIQTYLGPFGSAYIPPEIISQKDNFEILKKAKTELDVENYFFPSLYFVISAKPNIYIKSKDLKERKDENGTSEPFLDYEFSRSGQSLSWLRVSITLEPMPCKAEYPNDPNKEIKDADAIKVMAVSPEETSELLNESKPAQFARVGDELTNKLVPFASSDAASPLASKITGASGAISILFKNLFPPRAVAYSYAFIDSDVSGKGTIGSDTFGWYWRQKNVEAKPESIVGLRRSVAFLQVKRGVTGIKVKYRIDAKWSGDYSNNVDDEYVDQDSIPYKDLTRGDETIKFDKSYCLPPTTPPNFFQNLEYDFLPHIDNFPMMIPKEIVCNIYHKNIASLYFTADDIIDPQQLLINLKESKNKPLALLWEARKAEIMKKLDIEKEENWQTEVMARRPDFKLKQTIAEELNILLRDKNGDFYKRIRGFVGQSKGYEKIRFNTVDAEDCSSLSTEAKKTCEAKYKSWDEIAKEGNNNAFVIFYRKVFAEEYTEILKDYEPKDECSKWFGDYFNGNIETSSGEKYVRREFLKEKLQLPTLKEETEALRNLLKPKTP